MAGINLLKQLNARAAEEALAESGASPKVSLGANLTATQKIRLFLFFAGFALFFYGRGYFMDTYLPEQLAVPQARLQEIDQEIAVENQKKQQVADLEVELRNFEERVAELKDRIEKIKRVRESNRDRIVRMVDYIISEMPEPIWIRELKIESKPGSTVSFRGNSMTYQTISSFVTKLEQGAFFRNWQINGEIKREKVSLSNKKEGEATAFDLTAQVVDTP